MDTTISTAISGVHAAITRHDVTAHDVANVNTPGFEERSVVQTETAPAGTRIAAIRRTPNADAANSNTDLATEAVEQIQNKDTLSANLKVIKIKDRMMEDLLNLIS